MPDEMHQEVEETMSTSDQAAETSGTNNSETPVPSNPVFNWMQAIEGYRATNPLQQIMTKEQEKKEPVGDLMHGGWRFEGKEKPVTPRICTKCQWERRNEQQEIPDRSGWCQSCLEGKTLGHEPEGGRPAAVSSAYDAEAQAAAHNAAFFGQNGTYGQRRIREEARPPRIPSR